MSRYNLPHAHDDFKNVDRILKFHWQSAIVDSGIPHLDVLPVDEAIANPAEFLSGGELPRLMKELAGTYSRIVVDSARIC